MRNEYKLVKLVLVGFCLVGWSLNVFSQPFDSGSDGSYGPIVADNAPLQVPEDGIFHATTITISASRTLSFTSNAANTPIYLLATGNIIFINGGSRISVNGLSSTTHIGGLGGPGGFDGGARGVLGAPPGDGHGPGGGNGGVIDSNDPDFVGSGSFATVGTLSSPNNGSTYGTALMMPMVGGSGGGGTDTAAGGGGAGAITIASNTEIRFLAGSIQAIGANVAPNGSGSGGSIRLVAPKIAGPGLLHTSGTGGAGRARADMIDFSEFALTGGGDTVFTVGSLMQVFPTTSPSLAIIEAAGEAIPEGSTTPVDIFLADGTSASQDVIVQARDFTGMVPIRVKVTPDSGDSVAYDDTIDMGTGNPATVTVAVQIPVNEPVSIEAWTTDP